jgi:hypothetical protein
MRLSVILLLAALAGVLGGGALIGLPALGACLVFDSLCVGAWALLRDDGARGAPGVHEVPTLAQVLERARAS